MQAASFLEAKRRKKCSFFETEFFDTCPVYRWWLLDILPESVSEEAEKSELGVLRSVILAD